MKTTARLILTSSELRALTEYARNESKVRTYDVRRDATNRLYIKQPNGADVTVKPEPKGAR